MESHITINGGTTGGVSASRAAQLLSRHMGVLDFFTISPSVVMPG